MLLRLAYLTVTNTFAALRLPMRICAPAAPRVLGGDHDFGLGAGAVRDQLSEVSVVGLLKLVLDHDDAPLGVLEQEVESVPADGILPVPQFEREPDGLAENIEVVGEPRGEVLGLVGPDGA
ncbi:hypothetical protein ITP53_14755 [Nonomuraea sp. K274]|uniref:Uncharacterized protein n=1 Tax=Nonomuraea cypriaca TaxID=1187855 RepID=A0A931AAD5_9ACTN|nr:hypothetical protein [Nonomuraea cypriaca]MBF8186978.1 hypothetical protein [Nonomuraea cypriaca]